MKLRSKLFIPLILFSLMIIGYSHFLWLPKYTETVLNNHQSDIQAHLRTAAEGLVPTLLEDRLANVYENLDALLKQNKRWLQIRLINADGILLYPIELPEEIPPGPTIRIYQQEVSFEGPPVATLSLTVDLGDVIAHAIQLENNFQFALYLLLAIVIVSVGAIVEFVVRSPVKGLAFASTQLARGNYHAEIPHKTKDEIGDLIGNFVNMRNAIEAYQSDLKREIIDHKETARELVKQKELASYQASHDALTGLINRREFEKRVNNALDLSRSDGCHHVLLYIDLDQFKVVNDTCGHVAGDMLLRQLSYLLQGSMRQHDTLARLGGDEFGVLFEYCDVSSAKKIAGKLLETVQDFRFTWEDKLFNIGASVGAVEFSTNFADYFAILSAADSACYSAKEQGRNRIQIFQPEDAELSRRKGEMLWVTRLTQSLQNNDFVLYCQEVKPLKDDIEINHFEVLLRMKGQNGKIINADQFITSAERYNLISSLDKWVIDKTLESLAQLPKHLMKHLNLHVSVNLSGVSLGDNDTLSYIEHAFEKHKLPPGHVGLEITETAAIQRLPQAIDFMKRMKKYDCKFYLDDFGSGLSSYSYLKSIPADYVKIDGTFVKDIDKDPVDLALVKSITEVSRIMGKRTIAEYAESPAIISKLKMIGVDCAQGYGIGAPCPFDEMLASLMTEKELMEEAN